MKNLTDTETLLFIGFIVLCVCVVFMLGLCIRHGCLYRFRQKEGHAPGSVPPFSLRLQRTSSVIATPTQALDKKPAAAAVWVDSVIDVVCKEQAPVITPAPEKEQAPAVWVDRDLQEEKKPSFRRI